MKIVIVDDSAFVRKFVRDILEEQTDLVLVGEATNIDEGLSVVLRTKPDVLILDIVMEGGSGLHLLHTVMKLDCGCKVIMLTNYVEEQIRQQAMALGAAHFLDKAFEFEKLIEAIRS